MTTQSKNPRQISLLTEPDPVVPEPLGPVVLKLAPVLKLTDEQLLELCSLNDAVRIELNTTGELELLPPAGGTTGNRNFSLATDLGNWVRTDGTGVGFDSSAGFTLPNNAIRSPDVAWILKERWARLSDEEKHKFAHIVPDFVIELRSPSDGLRGLHAKMEEYMENGVRLGWLIDPLDPRHRVYIYRPDTPVVILEEPETLSGEPELQGFVLDLKPVWEPGF